jgi:cytochrome c553
MASLCAAVTVAAVELAGLPALASAQDGPIADRIAQCAACHGEDGNSRLENVPSLAGQPELFLLNQLVLMRDGVRTIPVMAPLVRDLTDADIQAIARYFSALAPKSSGEPIDAEQANRGRLLAAKLRCGSCHLPGLEGRQQIPRLATQRIDYLTRALKEYRDGTRAGADTLMNNAVAGVSDVDLGALAHYATAPGEK